MAAETDRLLSQIQTYAKADTVLAFSGGVDSALLLCLLSRACRETGRQVYAVTFHTALHPQADLKIARQLAQSMGISHHVLEINEFENPRILENPPDRCYHCKKMLFEKLWEFARERQTDTVLEGSNKDDLSVYRPGLRAVEELGVKSPLAQCGVTKAQVRQMAAEYGLSVASRPSVPCLATRLPYGTPIDAGLLSRIDAGEQFLRNLSFGNVRIRVHKDVARLEMDPEDFPLLLERREEILQRLKELKLPYVTLDLEGFRSGSMDIQLHSPSRQTTSGE